VNGSSSPSGASSPQSASTMSRSPSSSTSPSSRSPTLAATSGNFWRALILTLLVLVWFVRPDRVTSVGVLMAVICGALASGVGYTIWYGALPGLSRWRASLVQLTVPVLTALAATVLLDEAITLRLAGATALVVAGVWLSVRR